MNPPIIFIPHAATSSKSPELKAMEESLRRYDKQELRDAFMAGSKWQRGDDTAFPWLAVFLIFFTIIQIVGAMGGLMDGSLGEDKYKSKWSYVFWLREPARAFASWMGK